MRNYDSSQHRLIIYTPERKAKELVSKGEAEDAQITEEMHMRFYIKKN